ncbi:MAG: V-type ATP synthase subunit I [Candidatus Thermoplasmatota archaeon]|jgi:V/A-type H+-transporting ATPase subunit I|nr:V-type ATP synthase subunit I [Candidatus Thermoplasmatota archaeon]
MKKVTLVVHQNYIEDVVKNLHETGLMEIIDVSREKTDGALNDLEQASVHPEAGVCATYELRLSRVIDILKKSRKQPSGLKAVLHPQLPKIKIVKEKNLKELFSEAEDLLGEIEKNTIENEQILEKINEQKQRINQDFQIVKHLTNFDFDLSDIGESSYIIIKAGKTSDIISIKTELKKNDRTVLHSKWVGTKKKPEWVAVIAAYISEKDSVERICRDKLVEFDLRHLKGSPDDVLNSLKKEMIKLEKERIRIASHLQKISEKQFDDLLVLREEIQLERVKKEVSKNFAKTQKTYVIRGWVLEKKEEELKKLVKHVSKDLLLYSSEAPSVNPDNPPTYIEVPFWAKPFKTFVDLFSTPKYNELNPTVILAVFFMIFFGIMLGDAGYGMILIILSIFGLLRFGKYSSFIKEWSIMGLLLGITTTIFGFLTYSFFGDFIPRFFFDKPSEPLYSFTVFGVRFPIEPLRDPISILTVALILGLIQLNVGVLLAIYQSYKRREFKNMLTKNLCWIPLQIGGGLLIGYYILGWDISNVLIYTAAVLTLTGFILLFIKEGPLGFFRVTGYIGDWLSYARLLALGLATSGMALAFNTVAEILPQIIPIVGLILMPIVLIIAHTVNLGLNTLGAGVHSLRLQYVEFFNRFYEGGGRAYSPFKTYRRYTRLKNENIK